MASFVFCFVFVLLAHSQALSCYIVQEKDPSSGRYRWMVPAPDPCQCTQIELGGKNTQTPSRPFNVTYYDTFIISNNQEEIQTWLKCPDVTCSTKDIYTSAGVTSDCTNDVIVTYGTICQLSCDYGYIHATSSASCQSNGHRIGVWSGNTLNCKVVNCQTTAPDNGYIKCGYKRITGTNQSSPIDTCECEVTCQGSYTLIGSANITCPVDGNCDVSGSECTKEIKCKYSPVPSDDHIRKENGTCTGGALIGSTCQLSCDTGFILSTGGNSTTRTCQLYCSTERWVIWQNICNYFSSTKWHPLVAPSCLAISSCREYIEAGHSHGNGNYLVSPRCLGNSLSPITVYCDQESNGGGWMRLYYKSGGECVKYPAVDWSRELVSCLGLDNNRDVSFAVSDDVTTLSTNNSWILNGCSWSVGKDEPDDVIANLANCKTPTGDNWSATYQKKLVHITGVFSTFGDWSSMNDGCGQYIHVGNNTSFRVGGERRNKGEFVNIDSTCDTENALKSLWDEDDVRVMWIKT
ncbi:E-selectin-like [Asterias amurensis]|uniref:E-selectin-like n=1 Tax=Asterias amurensis TaxID=7602 RepID=UPI003AB3BC27